MRVIWMTLGLAVIAAGDLVGVLLVVNWRNSTAAVARWATALPGTSWASWYRSPTYYRALGAFISLGTTAALIVLAASSWRS